MSYLSIVSFSTSSKIYKQYYGNTWEYTMPSNSFEHLIIVSYFIILICYLLFHFNLLQLFDLGQAAMSGNQMNTNQIMFIIRCIIMNYLINKKFHVLSPNTLAFTVPLKHLKQKISYTNKINPNMSISQSLQFTISLPQSPTSITLKVKVKVKGPCAMLQKQNKQALSLLLLLNKNSYSSLLNCIGRYDVRERMFSLQYQMRILSKKQVDKCIKTMFEETVKVLVEKYLILFDNELNFCSSQNLKINSINRSHRYQLQQWFKNSQQIEFEQQSMKVYGQQLKQSIEQKTNDQQINFHRETKQVRTIYTKIQRKRLEIQVNLSEENLHKNPGVKLSLWKDAQFEVILSKHQNVIQGTQNLTQTVIVKEVDTRCESEEKKMYNLYLIMRENEILREKLIRGINIIPHYNCPFNSIRRDQYDRKVITKKSGQNAYNYLSKKTNKPILFIQEFVHILLQAFEAIDNIHTKAKIIHRDFEFKNIVVERVGNRTNVNLIDFGYSITFEGQDLVNDLEGYQEIQRGFIRILAQDKLNERYSRRPQYDVWKIFNGKCMQVLQKCFQNIMQFQNISKCYYITKGLNMLFKANKFKELQQNMTVDEIRDKIRLLQRQRIFIREVYDCL